MGAAITMDGSDSRGWGQKIQHALEVAGVAVNGGHAFDIQVSNHALFQRALRHGQDAIWDAYVDGSWDCPRIDELVFRLLRNGVRIQESAGIRLGLAGVLARLLPALRVSQASQVRRHYDLGRDLFEAMLDRLMIYSCAFWRNSLTLDQAQEAKLDLIARKLFFRPGMRVLDVGCGWGGAARYLAQNYGVAVVGVTLSRDQYDTGARQCAGLPVEIRLQDYRDVVDGPYDAIFSVGMFEHVGCRHYRTYMKKVRRLLKPGGLSLLHTIGSNSSDRRGNLWVERNIFPGGMLPSARQIAESVEGLMVIEDWHNFGADYDKTLMAWFANFDANWPRLRRKYGERFYRLWKCYLQMFAGAFRARHNQLWQVVLSPSGVPGGYAAERFFEAPSRTTLARGWSASPR